MRHFSSSSTRHNLIEIIAKHAKFTLKNNTVYSHSSSSQWINPLTHNELSALVHTVDGLPCASLGIILVSAPFRGPELMIHRLIQECVMKGNDTLSTTTTTEDTIPKDTISNDAANDSIVKNHIHIMTNDLIFPKLTGNTQLITFYRH